MRYAVAFAFLVFSLALSGADYGLPLPKDELPVPLAAALHSPDPGHDRAFSGRVGRVCQKQGCWMMLIDGDASVRVMTGHRFFLPADTTGDATVYGRLIERELDAKTARHFSRESGGGEVAAGQEYRIDALGVRILP